jgi:hypothetical protein
MTVCNIKAWHVIDALIVDRAYQEEVSVNATISVSLVVDLITLKHEQGINELLAVREEESDRYRASNSSDDDDVGD